MRHYATFDCGIWDDPDGFVTLTAGAQRTYFMLVTQRDIAACGTLPMTKRRWASTCADNDVDEWIAELVRERYLLIDDDTEEVLVRTFMRWDGGYKHAKRVQAVIASVLAIRSQSIRSAAVEELARLGVSVPTPEEFRSRRSVVKEVGYVPNPHSATTTPESATQEREPAVKDDPRSMFCPPHQPNGALGPCRDCATRRVAKQEEARRQLEDEVRARKTAKAAIAACDLCDAKGVREHPVSRQPLGRCNHDPLEAVS